MADRETTVTNAYESTLAAELSATASSVDLTDVTGLTAPFYLVIEPDDAGQREYVLVTALAGSTATIGERYLAGSAAASGLVHPAGAVIRHAFVAQHLTDINDRVDAAGNHANLTNVTADDHHAESHQVASHSDTTATGAELETLTDGSDADALHVHGSVDEDGHSARHPALRAVRASSNQTMPGNTDTTIIFNSLVRGDGDVSINTSTGVVTIGSTGWYHICVGGNFVDAINGTVQLRIDASGTGTIAQTVIDHDGGGALGEADTVCTLVYLAATSTVEAKIYHELGAGIVDIAPGSFIGIHKVAA